MWTSWPLRTSSCTPDGVIATRYSLFLTSRGIATFTGYQRPLPMHRRRCNSVVASIGRPKACVCESKPADSGHDAGPKISRRRQPRGGVGRRLVTGSNVLDRVLALVTGRGEPNKRYAASLGELDLLAELCSHGCYLTRDSAPAQRSGNSQPRRVRGADTDDRGQLSQTLGERLVLDAQCVHPLDKALVRRTDPGQGQAPLGLFGGRARGLQQIGDVSRTDLVQLVNDPQHRRDVGEAHAEIEPLGNLAVVHLDPERADRQLAERIGDHQRQLGLVVRCKLAHVDDVDVALQELAVSPLLGTLTTPYRLDLVAAEGERQLAGVLQDVSRERDGQVEVQPKP